MRPTLPFSFYYGLKMGTQTQVLNSCVIIIISTIIIFIIIVIIIIITIIIFIHYSIVVIILIIQVSTQVLHTGFAHRFSHTGFHEGFQIMFPNNDSHRFLFQVFTNQICLRRCSCPGSRDSDFLRKSSFPGFTITHGLDTPWL